jgi:uncharacterized damage-inducible protein DinB
MTVNDLLELFDYGRWANGKLFAAMAALTPEQFTQPVHAAHGSIRNTMVHVLSAEWGWLGRCGGPERGPALDFADYPTVASLVALDKRIGEHVREFLPRLRDEDLAREVEFPFPGGEKHVLPVGQMLHHAANHGAHHRGQVSLLLRMLGLNPDNFDLLLYHLDRRQPKSGAG